MLLRSFHRIMERLDLSCGVVPIKRTETGTQVLLCKSRRHGYYLIPKGHIDPGETELQAAIRELWEESGCRPTKFWSTSGWTEDFLQATQLPRLEYVFQSRNGSVRKSVKLYMAEVNQEADIQDKHECESADWFPMNEDTAQLLNFQENIRHFIENVIPKV